MYSESINSRDTLHIMDSTATFRAPQSEDFAPKLAQLTVQPSPSQALKNWELPFRNLPSELRTMIWNYTLPGEELRDKKHLTLPSKFFNWEQTFDEENRDRYNQPSNPERRSNRFLWFINQEADDFNNERYNHSNVTFEPENTTPWPISLLLAPRQVYSEAYPIFLSRAFIRLPSLNEGPFTIPTLYLPIWKKISCLTVQFTDARHAHVVRQLQTLTHLEIVLPRSRQFADDCLRALKDDKMSVYLPFNKQPSSEIELSIRWPRLEEECVEHGFSPNYRELTKENLDLFHREGDGNSKRGYMSWRWMVKSFVSQRDRLLRIWKNNGEDIEEEDDDEEDDSDDSEYDGDEEDDEEYEDDEEDDEEDDDDNDEEEKKDYRTSQIRRLRSMEHARRRGHSN